MSRIIGLLGESGVGKDTVALEFQRYGFQPLALADDCKIDLAMMYDIPLPELYGVRSAKMRDATIEYAEAQRAVHGEGHWVRRLLLKIEQLRMRGIVGDVVVPDVRKQIEIDMINAVGGKVYLVSAPSRIGSNGMTEKQRSQEEAIPTFTGVTDLIDNEPGAVLSIAAQVRDILGYQQARTMREAGTSPFRLGV